MMKSRRLIPIIVFCLYLAAVLYICFAKPEDIPRFDATWFGLPSDKIIHFAMFLPFPILAYLVFEFPESRWYWKAVTIFVIIIIGIGLAWWTEKMQSKLTYRTSDIKDFLSNIYGIASGGLITIIYTIFRR